VISVDAEQAGTHDPQHDFAAALKRAGTSEASCPSTPGNGPRRDAGKGHGEAVTQPTLACCPGSKRMWAAAVALALVYAICLRRAAVRDARQLYAEPGDNRLLKLAGEFPFTAEPPIDLVIPWAGEVVSKDKRQRDNGELKYALRAYARYAPWLRRIYILQNTGQPQPSFLEHNDWVVQIDRCTLFTNKSHCPTKNGHAAYAVAPRVPSLSERFLLVDDDVFLTAPAQPSDFFDELGRPIVHTAHRPQPIYPPQYHVTIPPRPDQDWPVTKWAKYDHRVRPLRRSWINQVRVQTHLLTIFWRHIPI